MSPVIFFRWWKWKQTPSDLTVLPVINKDVETGSQYVGRVVDIKWNSGIRIPLDSNRERPLALNSVFNHLSKGYTAPLSQVSCRHDVFMNTHTHTHTLTKSSSRNKNFSAIISTIPVLPKHLL